MLAHGAVAPWILLTSPDERGLTELIECEDCGLYFFSRSFTEAELSQLYGNYRGESYFNRRHRWEPWYSSSVNDAIGHSESTIADRRSHLEDFLSDYALRYSVKPPTCVVDFGGDEGQFIPESTSIHKRGVFEVSESRPVTGVAKLADWDEVSEFEPDLMMLCHVLEHTHEAREIVVKAYKALRPGTLIYIEVPLDRPPKPPKTFASGNYQRFTKWAYKRRSRWVCLDFVALVSKRYLKRLLIGAVVKQSEHVQFFDQRSIEHVLNEVGFKNLEFSRYMASGGVPRLRTAALGVLATKPG